MNKLGKNNESLEKLSNPILWEKLTSMTKDKEIIKKFSQIPKETYRFALKNSNRKFLLESAFKSLKKNDPKATREQAESLADMLHIFAKMLVSEVEAVRKEKKTA